MNAAPRELCDFARSSGYRAVACPACCGQRVDSDRCTNCGGSGRLWSSPNGSLADDGLERLRRLMSDPCDPWGATKHP